MRALKHVARVVLDTGAWKQGHLDLLVRQFTDRNRNAWLGRSDDEHMAAAAAWVARAQDATPDGGIVGRYDLRRGWTSSYPETSGYLIPTLLRLSEQGGAASWLQRAKRCVHFLLALQLPDGAFPGGEVHENTSRSSVFNTAQIVNGLVAWHAFSADEPTLTALRRAGDWLCNVQDPDGAWRQHVYLGLPTTYTTHASCWLAELGRHLGETRYVEAAVRHMDWALQHVDQGTGWIDLAGFTAEDHQARCSVTHTIAYTLWGILTTALIVGRSDAVDTVRRAALAIARRVQLTGWLPGKLDSAWKAAAKYECLTGNAQMALIWMRLYGLDGDGRLLNAALIALDRVKESQDLTNRDPGIRGGIAGSAPVWGQYIRAAYPNWAAKFFIDAMLDMRAVLPSLPNRPRVALSGRQDVPAGPPPLGEGAMPSALRVVLLSGEHPHKVVGMVRTWRLWGFRPAAVVIERPLDRPATTRIAARIRSDGLRRPSQEMRVRPSSPAGFPTPEAMPADLTSFCTVEQIPVVEVESLSQPAGIAALQSLAPDLCVHAGAGIIRAGLLKVPRLGVLNAHMGILPPYRGMNVAEWAIFNRSDPGCTVHLIDLGIDTGDILCVRTVSPTGAASLQAVRDMVDAEQIRLLGEVLRYVMCTGHLPPRHAQRPEEGRQYFRMHRLIRAALDRELEESASSAPSLSPPG
jgi:Formyl transferase/Prenyltransferase and squalene oxidase repeat